MFGRDPFRRRRQTTWLTALPRLSAAIGLLATAVIANPAAAQTTVPSPNAVESLPVSFQVVNRNDSNVPCLADGKTYTVRGHLVGPAADLRNPFPRSVTTYLHGIGWGEFYWHFQSQPEYDYATLMAQRGHTSLVYDQLGYGASDRTPGLLNCYGSEASVANQIIGALKTGRYTVVGRTTVPTFAQVALASNQAAALVSQPTVYSYSAPLAPNADALIVTSFADFAGAFKPAFALQSAPFFSRCLLGGEPSDGPGGSGPRFYVNFPPSDEAFASVNFANADPAIVAAATAARGRSPCGEALSAFQTIGLDSLQILLRQVRVPVLIVNGLDDAFFIQPLGGTVQRRLYPNSPDVTVAFIANAGQALTLERTAPDFRNVMDAWLRARRF